MDPQHLAETLKHLSKQDELLREVLGSLQSELTKLKAEEQLLMEKYTQLKNPLELIIRSESDSSGLDGQTGQAISVLTSANIDSAGDEVDHAGLDSQTIPLLTSGRDDSAGDEVDHAVTTSKDT